MKDPYTSVKRSIVIHETETSVVLEGLYWQFIDMMASQSGNTWRRLVQTLLSAQPAEFQSRAAWLRWWVTSSLALTLKRARGGKPADLVQAGFPSPSPSPDMSNNEMIEPASLSSRVLPAGLGERLDHSDDLNRVPSVEEGAKTL